MNSKAKKKKILFVSYGGGHINALLPVIKKLRENKLNDVIVLGLTTAKFVLEKHNIPFITFKDLLLPSDTKALEWGSVLANQMSVHQIPLDESIAYMGLSYWDLELCYGEKKASDLFNKKGRQAFLPITIFNRFYDDLKPDLVVATSSPRAEKAAILSAISRGIKSACVADLFAITEVEWLSKANYANKVFVISEHVKNFLISHGRDEKDIIVSGNPAFDSLMDPGLIELGEKYKLKNCWKEKKIILWASQPEPSYNHITLKLSEYPTLPILIEEQLLKIAAIHSDWRIIFRLHPSEKREYYSLPKNVTLSSQEDNLHALLSVSDMVLTMTSTVGLEALYLKKRLVTVDLSVCREHTPYSAMGFSEGVSDLNNLQATLEKVLSNPIKKVDLFFNENATDKVIFELEELLHS